jgi:glutamine amidotransferase-like uncharacterized protein
MIVGRAPEFTFQAKESVSRRIAFLRCTLALACASVIGCALGVSTCTNRASVEPPLVLLYTGTGTSANDVHALTALLLEMRVSYVALDANDLDRMTTAQMQRSRLLIVPGGDFLTIGGGLTPRTLQTTQQAVHDGLNYLGVCAGAFLAGKASYPSLNLTAGTRFDFYGAASSGVRKAAVSIASPDGSALDHYWEDGPQLTGWGAVVARYPDGTPAVVEGRSGRGWVVLTGIHPEAPDSWRRGLHFATPARVDHAYARVLIDAALHGTSLPHF